MRGNAKLTISDVGLGHECRDSGRNTKEGRENQERYTPDTCLFVRRGGGLQGAPSVGYDQVLGEEGGKGPKTTVRIHGV